MPFLSAAWLDAVRSVTRSERIPAPFSDTANLDLVVEAGEDEGVDQAELRFQFRHGLLTWEHGRSATALPAQLTLIMAPVVAYDVLVAGSPSAGEDALYEGGLRTVGDANLLRALRGYRFWCESDRVSARLVQITDAPMAWRRE